MTLRVDIVTIFPGYLDPLGLSLVGKARADGLLDIRIHDLRRWTDDVHRTVDDTPFGGGAGMLMRPEPWGRALDEITDGAPVAPRLVVPTPAGWPFVQATAAAWSQESWFVLACGRYEGIDERVLVDYARRGPVSPISVGDYVLAGGEAAALVVVEAVARLVPGVLGNAASLAEESHVAGLLEYPAYTRPAEWRGLAVPDVLRSGDHARISKWRHDEAVRRTAERRPDLLGPRGDRHPPV